MELVMPVPYIAIIRKEPNTPYWVDIPDIPGCIASGDTIGEAKAAFAGALKMHLAGLKEDGLSLSPARSREEVLASDNDPDMVEAYGIEIEAF
jgi:predicted RNase H-like HicB family nuclease